jgi:hypothetical protein
LPAMSRLTCGAIEPARNDWLYDLQVMKVTATRPKTLI